MRRPMRSRESAQMTAVAAGGLLDRRAFLSGSAAMAAGFTAYALAPSARAEPLTDDPWSRSPGNLTPPYEQRSRFEDKVVRTLTNPKGEPRVQNARTPLHLTHGTITPAGLHFVVSQAGSPDIDPARHRLVIHGLVKRPLMPYDALRDFATITLGIKQPNVFSVHPSLPAKSVKELIALARARPGELPYASAGVGAISHLTIELFLLMLVPFSCIRNA